jgi:bifunctional non-homologous end joining protein LigD
VEFNTWPSRIKSFDSPDYIILAIESPDYELAKAIDVALAAKEILTGLKLPAFVKTDGSAGLHIYIPLDARSGFDSSMHAAEYLCKLVRLKVPDLVRIKGSKEDAYTKVSLDYTLIEKSQYVVAPYSLVADSANVAAPLLWEEVREGLASDEFSHDTIFKRLKGEGNPFEALFRKKVNADAVLEKLRENYSFLF